MLTLVWSMAEIMDKKEKITALYDRYYSLMCYTVKQKLPPEHHGYIDDIVQDALLDIMEYIDNVDIEDEIKTRSLCITIARCRAVDHIRKRDNNNLSFEDIYANGIYECQEPDILLDKRATVDIIVKAIGSLDDSYRDVCRLKYIHQKTEKQIAKILGLTPKAVNMRAMRGKAILKKILRKELYGE